MPHVEIKCLPGRSQEQKQTCADKIVKAVSETMGCPEGAVSVAIIDIPDEEWEEKVWNVNIKPQKDKLFREPDYEY